MKRNTYRSNGSGLVFGSHAGQQHKSRALICGQILALSASTISEAFDGVVGKPLIEGIRHAMILELDGCTAPLSGWREIADRVKGRESCAELAM